MTHSATAAPATAAHAGVSASDARAALWVLTLINMVNYIDRYVVSALVESLKKSEIAPSDLQLGLLMSSFLIVYMMAAPVFGMLGDRGSRKRIIASGVAIWSIATGLSGLARNFAGLLGARAAVGVGEAAYGTVAPSLLADYFPRERRGRVFAIFYMAIPMGSALGYVVGGLVDRHFGWRAAFFVAGMPGLILALLVLRLREPMRGIQEVLAGEAPPPPAAGMLATYRQFIRNRFYTLTVLGYTAYTFAVGGLAFWMPAFLERVHQVPRAQATIGFGGIVVVTGLAGTIAGGWLGDYFLKTSRQAYLWVSAIATLLAVPFAVLALGADSPMIYFPALVVAQLLLFASTGPINSAIVNAVPAQQRASAVALSIFTIHVLGDVISPPLIGAIADVSSLSSAVMIVPVAMTLCAAFWIWAAKVGQQAAANKSV